MRFKIGKTQRSKPEELEDTWISSHSETISGAKTLAIGGHLASGQRVEITLTDRDEIAKVHSRCESLMRTA